MSASAHGPVSSRAAKRNTGIARGRLGEHGAGILVATVSSAFGVTLLLAIGVVTALVQHSALGAATTVQVALTAVGTVFIVIAVYVGAIVTVNTFSTIVAGRVRVLALLRLIGASAGSLRRDVAREGLVVGVIGAAIGTAVGVAMVFVGTRILIATGALPNIGYPLVEVQIIIPPVVVVLTTWLSAWVGSRRVLALSPMEATGATVETRYDELARRSGRKVGSVVLFLVGILVVGLGMLVGAINPLGVVVGVLGGVLSFTGLVLAAPVLMPPVLRVSGRLLGRSAPARLAAANAVRNPERSARTTIGLTIGITLITMFAVAESSFAQIIHAQGGSNPQAAAQTDQVLTTILDVFIGLIAVSAVIAAIGMVSTLSMSVLQRRRELGLLRALGFSAGQVRWMITAESVAVSLTAVALGLVLGVFYGWAGAQSLLGSLSAAKLVAPTVPAGTLVILVVAGAVLALLAAIAPSRRATRLAPVEALAVD